jgi:hypothetical protein
VLLSAPVLLLPLVPMLPDQLPEAVQLLAFVDDQLSIEAEPLVTVLGLAFSVTVGFATPPVTWIANAGSEALALPSLTLITIPEVIPTLDAVGVPLSCPVATLNTAHDGLFAMEYESVPPEGSEALGVNE